MACLREPCPSAWMLNRSAFVHPDPVHLRMAARKKKWTHPLAEAGHSRGHLQNLWSFYFTSSSPPPLKETGIHTPIRWFFRDTGLPSSRSAGFPNKVVFLAWTPRLRFIGLSCGEQGELGPGNIVTSRNTGIKPSPQTRKVRLSKLCARNQRVIQTWLNSVLTICSLAKLEMHYLKPEVMGFILCGFVSIWPQGCKKEKATE